MILGAMAAFLRERQLLAAQGSEGPGGKVV